MDVPLDDLEKKLELLARKWERYFAGDREVPIPPERERQALARQLQVVSRMEGLPTAVRFRLDGLLHRFSSYCQLWERQLRARNEARRTADALAAASVKPADEVDRLYRDYVEAMERAGKKPAWDREGLRRFLDGQKRRLEEQGFEVQGFSLVASGGGVSLKAKARKKKEGS
ncbi:hypothetical protein HRbin09_01067 [bacterium HR09]|nr:hypothetical protein HRbin09_01067 [bacterium HR09]